MVCSEFQMYVSLKRKMLKLFKCKTKYAVLSPFVIFTLYFVGFFALLLEKDFSRFSYPLEIDVLTEVRKLMANRSDVLPPINLYNYSYHNELKHKCSGTEVSTYRLIYLVKSAAENFGRRAAIRKTWGFERRFSDVDIVTVFFIGEPSNGDLQEKLKKEMKNNQDVVQIAFRDSYYNNTIKMMMSMKWAVTNCPNSKFYLFIDDDMYLSTKNLLKFIRNPVEYPEYLENPIISIKGQETGKNKILGQVIDMELPPDAELYAGYAFHHSKPQRQLFSKWYVSLAEYPFSRFPPYITAASIILSKESLLKIYYASFFTQHFRFDDIYVSILAKKVNIEPLHCGEFYFHKKKYTSDHDYRYVIASHGYGNPTELIEVWNRQKFAGNA